MEEIIKKFLSVGSGDSDGDGDGDGSGVGSGDGSGDGSGVGSGSGSGSGYGYGYGYGSGSGYDSGYGYGSGSGYGVGSGSGYGVGYGYGIKSYNEREVYIIDGIQAILYRVHGNYVKGTIINEDLTLTDCYIAKCGNYFAHGDTLRKAMQDAQNKYDENRPIEDRLADFIARYPTLDSKASHEDLFNWHHVLTGSCLMGRSQFCKERGIDPEHGEMTIADFIELTIHSFGGNVIQQLSDMYNNK